MTVFQTPEEIQELIANGERLVREAEEALAENDRFFERHNIDPRKSIEFLRQHAGEAAVQMVKDEVKRAMESINEQVEQQRLHRVKARPAGKKPRMPRNMI
jgi:hypothetical protein